MDEKYGKSEALKDLLMEVKSWKKESLEGKLGKKDADESPEEEAAEETEEGMREEPIEESDKEHSIIERLVALLGK